ncbi:MAG: GTPase HflX [Chloroflexi bacterium]|nr:GTPase HflX [Chloroflexota bacterium]MCY3583854.1 GTPase HflX [Chloroflexota bacterium]MCY3716214.1 GTPase HflX [Chloroflexota bacterium]MDE2650457.1 GTPase HflX [Chloroflexota bacterium]MXX84145.1 GTPase HflX [Chloroflexota bacterium]
MTDFAFRRDERAERAYLVGVALRQSQALISIADSLAELALLAETAGIHVVGQSQQTLRRINPKTFVGSGKLAEIAEQVIICDANVVIFDDELSPRHQREIEKQLGESVRLLDRSALILDIFAQHARTSEGALQVELAQYEYRLPRLTRQWTHLARQAGGGAARGGAGGVGLRGPGETQLEVDRREITRKITRLKADLEHVRAHRSLHRARRQVSGLPLVALVGYTNAGKSTLINALSDSDIYVADQLFATLDPTTRRIPLPDGSEALLSDTVGFIQKLPTTLIAAFRATLEEVTEADLLLHVVDISHPNATQHIEAVEDILAEIDAAHMPRLLILNKVDRLPGGPQPPPLIDNYAAIVPVSAREGLGLDALRDAIGEVAARQSIQLDIVIPYQAGQVYSDLYDKGYIESERTSDSGWELRLRLPQALRGNYQRYAVRAGE